MLKFFNTHVNSFEGILAGVCPCGVIVLLSELYGSESKLQVYGCVHNHLKCHPQVAQRTGKANYTMSLYTSK